MKKMLMDVGSCRNTRVGRAVIDVNPTFPSFLPCTFLAPSTASSFLSPQAPQLPYFHKQTSILST